MSERDPAPGAGQRDPGVNTSLTLLERVRANDAEAWRRLVFLYSPLVHFWCRRAGLHEADAADVLQDVFLAVAGAVAGFDRRAGGAFRAWLWTITRNKLRDHFRRLKDRPEAAGGSEAHRRLLDVPDEEPAAPADPSDPGSATALLRRALELIRGDFEERTWQAFYRATVEGQPAAALAAELGLSVDAVYQAKARVLRRLREELGNLID
jgi:RNA polymerase sigma-70 factor (ECF subfamily)